MTNQDVQKTGNQHSPLLDQLIKAAEDVKPKEITPFKDTIIKIASETPPSLRETLTKVAQDLDKHKKILKPAQFDAPPVPDEPNFDAMAEGTDEGFGDDAGLEGDMEDLEGAKQHLADALVALCGSVDDAVACLQGGQDSFGEEEAGAELGDDMVPQELLTEEPADMAKPMIEEPMQEQSIMEQNPIKQNPLIQ
jgi:hypothetical protein